jgi:hypothetical protein
MSVDWTPVERAAFEARRKSRNRALGLVLGALVMLFFGITIVKMAPVFENSKLLQSEQRIVPSGHQS